MARAIWKQEELSGNLVVNDIARTIADSLNEKRVNIESTETMTFRLTFSSKDAYFYLHAPARRYGDYHVDLSLYVDDKRAWSMNKPAISLMELREIITSYARNGFPRENKAPYKWGSSSKRSAAEIKMDVELYPHQERYVRAIVNGIGARRAAVTRSEDMTQVEIRFGRNKPWFVVIESTPFASRYERCAFNIQMRTSKGAIWHHDCREMYLDEFESFMKTRGRDGFNIDGKWWKWGTPFATSDKPVEDTPNRGKPGGSETPEQTIEFNSDSKVKWLTPAPENGKDIEAIAACVAFSLKEKEISIKGRDNKKFHLTFKDRGAYFELTDKGEENKRSFYIALRDYDTTVWNYTVEADNLEFFSGLLSECAEYGFTISPRQVYMWDRERIISTDDGSPVPRDKVVNGRQHVIWEEPALGDIASFTAIADNVRYCLCEDYVNVKSADDGTYCWLTFTNKSQLFMLYDEGPKHGTHGFTLTLYDNVKIWSCHLDTNEMTEFIQLFSDCAANGFPINDKQRYMWQTGKVAGEREEHTVVGSAGQVGVVPDGITSIRAVALKYDGKVIAFRFKTDKGSFDMSRDVASKFGINALKTDKFITLQNVNGILMSESEKSGQRVIPDVSECETDCTKLMNAIFNL